MNTEGYCSYKVSMLLKQLGFNEGCGSLYETAIRHNGKDLSFDDELDLKGAGRAKEIKYTKGGWISDHYNTNTSGWMHKDCCSRPTHAHATRWLRDTHEFHVLPSPLPFGEWKVWVIILGKPNTKDGMMNATDLNGKIFASFEDATEAGLSFILKSLVKARKEAGKLTPQQIKHLYADLRKKGFDVEKIEE